MWGNGEKGRVGKDGSWKGKRERKGTRTLEGVKKVEVKWRARELLDSGSVVDVGRGRESGGEIEKERRREIAIRDSLFQVQTDWQSRRAHFSLIPFLSVRSRARRRGGPHRF